MAKPIKLLTLVTLSIGLFVAPSPADDYLIHTETGPVADETAMLSAFIIPPAGTAKADVDSVYGEPKEYKEPPKIKASEDDYPMHTYTLLPPPVSPTDPRARATLYITYRNDKVSKAGINHYFGVRNPVGRFPSMPEDPQEKQRIENENQRTLIALKEINEKFADKLKTASWYKKQKPGATSGPADKNEPTRIETNPTPPPTNPRP
jgi:hypothetical protein